MKKLSRYILAFLLILFLIALVSTKIKSYNISPEVIYLIKDENLIENGNFESFNQTAGDCCNSNPNMSKVYAFKTEDSFEGSYALNLTSKYQCACISKPILNFSNSELYWLSFYYKGDNPRFCNWVNGDKKCLPNLKLNQSEEWLEYQDLLFFTNNSLSASIYFYADSSGEGTVTNLYDALEVHKLVPIEDPSNYIFNPEEEYIILTKSDNLVRNGELLKETAEGMAYFLVLGSPEVTIKFPWSELVIIVLIMLIIIRLLFKKQVGDVEKYVEKEIKKDTKYAEEKFVDIGRDFRDTERKVERKAFDAKKSVSDNVSHEADKVDEVAREIEKMPKKYYEYYKRKYDRIFEG